MSANNGGPAFPSIRFERVADYAIGETEGGMTLRDYFAGQALSAAITIGLAADLKEKEVATMCYDFADAMLAAREVTP
jgi:hypothetical protein